MDCVQNGTGPHMLKTRTLPSVVLNQESRGRCRPYCTRQLHLTMGWSHNTAGSVLAFHVTLSCVLAFHVTQVESLLLQMVPYAFQPEVSLRIAKFGPKKNNKKMGLIYSNFIYFLHKGTAKGSTLSTDATLVCSPRHTLGSGG